jgi:peptidoglycan/xylan/chitin deacetylase (PgdA/CDA1 family)
MTILCYHAVGPPSSLSISPERFARHAEWLFQTKRLLSLQEAVGSLDGTGLLPRGSAALTFDDGYDGLYWHAFPVLSRLRLPAAVFVVSSTIATPNRSVSWIRSRSLAASLQTLNLEQMLEMHESGVTFGSHSHLHQDLTTLTEGECQRDLLESREILEDALHGPVPYLAYPYGRHTDWVRRAARRAGFSHGFTLGENSYHGQHCIPRVGVAPEDGLFMLRMKTTRWFPSFRETRLFPLLRRALRGEAESSGWAS